LSSSGRQRSFGAGLRLRAAFDLSGFSEAARVVLRTLL
jgi:hypothetical protein